MSRMLQIEFDETYLSQTLDSVERSATSSDDDHAILVALSRLGRLGLADILLDVFDIGRNVDVLPVQLKLELLQVLGPWCVLDVSGATVD